MSWSYDLALSDPKDQVRLLLRDTNGDAPLMENEEIVFFLTTTNNSVFEAAALGCETLAAQFSSKADKQVGDLKISFASKQADYVALAELYSARAGSTGIEAVSIYSGGMTYTDKSIDETDTDLVQPAFRIGQFQDPSSGDPRVRP